MREEILKSLRWRYAVKKFDAQKKIAAADWQVLEDCLVQSPSSYGLQPWKFLVIENPELRKKMREVSWGQSQVTDSSHYVVFTYKQKMDEAHIQRYIDEIASVRGVSKESLDAYKKVMVGDVVHGPRAQVIEQWAQRQTYIAMGFLLETAALLKVDACPMEGLDTKAYDQLLKIEGTGWGTVAAVALGYRHNEDPLQHAKKVRFKNKEIIEFIK